MKSFGKTFRAILALSLALCMVMSCVAVSADETKVSLSVDTPTSQPVDGYYTVTATVDGLVAGNSATILVHKGEAPTNDTIGYANQDVIAEGKTSKTFTMELKKGTYTVLAGGTGKTAAAETTLTINGAAPAFAENAALEVITGLTDKTALAEVTVVENFPEATDADKEEVTYSIGGEHASKFKIVGKNIVLAENLVAGSYPFTLIATSVDGTAELAGTLVVAPTTVYVKPAAITATGTAGYGSTEESAKALLPEVVALVKEDGSATDKTVSVTYEYVEFAENVYTYKAIFGDLEEGYAWITDSNVGVLATVNYVDGRTALPSPTFDDITVQYGHDLILPTYDDEYLELAGEWKCANEGGFKNTVVGEYTFTNGVNVKEAYKNTHKLADDGAVEVVVNVVDERPVVVLNEVADQVIHFGQSAKEVKVEDYTDVAGAKLTDWEENVIDENTTEYTAKLTVNELTHKLDEEGTTEITVSYKVIYEELRDVIAEIVTNPADKEVGYNKVPDLSDVKAFANIDDKEVVELEFAPESVWTYVGEGEPDMTVIGAEYTYERAVVIDENSYIYTDEEAVATVVVKVVESRKVISNVKYSVTETEVAFGTETPAIPEGTFTADIDGVASADVPVVFEGNWTCNGYAKDTPGEYTFTRKVVIVPELSDEYKFDAEEVAVEVTVKVAKKDVKITGYAGFNATETFTYGKVGEYTLPTEVDAVAEGYEGKFQVAWDKAFSAEAGEVVYTGAVTVPADDATYNFDASEAEAPVITVTINYVVDGFVFYAEDGNGGYEVVENVYVDQGADFEVEVALGTFPAKVAFIAGDVESEKFDAVNWMVADGCTFPAKVWEATPIVLDTTEIKLADFWTWGEDAIEVSIDAITRGDAAFVVKVDNYIKKYVASLKSNDATVTIEGIDGAEIPGLATEGAYKFDIDGAEGVWQSDNFIKVAPVEGKSKHTVVATVKLQDGTEESQTVYINKYSTLFNGSVYINDTVENGKSYSAARVNKNRDIKVSHDFRFSNNPGYDFTGTTKVEVFKVVNDKLELWKTYNFDPDSKSHVIPASDVSTWDNATYRFVVTYDSNDDVIGTKTNARYVYISNNGTWYNSFLINGLSRSGIVIRNNEQLKNEIQLTELGDAGTVWIAHSLKTFSENPEEVLSAPYQAVSDKSYERVIELKDENGDVRSVFANNASYKFYTTLKLDGPDSDIEDMNIGRVVYIYKQVTAINTFAVNDSCKSDAIIKDGKLEFKPNWYKEARKDEFDYETLTYKLTFTEGVRAEDLAGAGVVEGGTVDGTTVTFTEAKGEPTSSVTIDASIFANRVKAELVVEIDGVEDARLPRTFYPKNASN